MQAHRLVCSFIKNKLNAKDYYLTLLEQKHRITLKAKCKK